MTVSGFNFSLCLRHNQKAINNSSIQMSSMKRTNHTLPVSQKQNYCLFRSGKAEARFPFLDALATDQAVKTSKHTQGLGVIEH